MNEDMRRTISCSCGATFFLQFQHLGGNCRNMEVTNPSIRHNRRGKNIHCRTSSESLMFKLIFWKKGTE